MSNGAEIVADALMDSLLTGETFTLPTVNLNDPAFNFPSIVGNPLYNAVSELTNEDLTTRTVGGNGTYDAIMASQAAHLKDEFNQGRITGAEYTKAYIALAQSAAGQAIQFLLGKDQAYWASVIAQGQALTARVQHETAKVQLAIAQVEMNNQRAAFALNKIRLANEDAQYGINKYNLDNTLPSQKAQILQQTTNLISEELGIVAKTAQTTQQTTNLAAEALNIPKQGDVLDKQALQIVQQTTNLVSEELLTDAKTAQTTQQTANLLEEKGNITKQGTVLTNQAAQITQQTTNLVSEELLTDAKTAQATQQTANLLSENANIAKQGLQIEAQTALSTQQKTNLVSEELNISKQGEVLDKQALHVVQQTTNLVSEELLTDAKTAQTTQQTANLLSENANISKQGALIDSNKAVQDAQKLSIEKTTEVADYNLDNLMPAQLTLIKEQGEVQRAQTLDTRSDAAAVAGSVKSQKDLYAQQVESYQHSAQTTAAKVWTDAWVADSAIQDSPIVPTAFTSANISSVLSALKTAHSL